MLIYFKMMITKNAPAIYDQCIEVLHCNCQQECCLLLLLYIFIGQSTERCDKIVIVFFVDLIIL